MKAQIVSFHCVLRDKLGKLISSTFNRDVITSAQDEGPMLKGLIDGLSNLKSGERRKISLSAEDAYGLYDPALVVDLERKQLSQGRSLKVGDAIVSQSANGRSTVFRVVAANPQRLTLDGNHPLAGQDLTFEIEATEARDANAEELAEYHLATSSSRPLPNWLH